MLIYANTCSQGEQRRLQQLAQTGAMLRLAKGIYINAETYASLPPWEKHRLKAVAFGAHGTHIIAGRSAAVLWGMWNMVAHDEPVEFYVARGHKPRKGGQQLHGRLTQDDRTNGAGCTATSIPRTLSDLARFHGFEDCFLATSWVLAHQACPQQDLEKAAKNNPVLRSVLQQVDPHVESAAEAYFLAQVRREGIIDVQVQVSLADSTGGTLRPDFQIRNSRILIEISGVGKYGESEEEQSFNVKKASDRMNRLFTAGYTIWTYSAAEVFSGYAYKNALKRWNDLRGHHFGM